MVGKWKSLKPLRSHSEATQKPLRHRSFHKNSRVAIKCCHGKLLKLDHFLDRFSFTSVVARLYGTETAFLAVMEDGKIFAWGEPWCGGEIGPIAQKAIDDALGQA